MTAVLQLSGQAPVPTMLAGQAVIGRGWQRAIGKAQGEAWFLGPLSAGHRTGAAAAIDRSLAAPAAAALAVGAAPVDSAQAVVPADPATTHQPMPLSRATHATSSGATVTDAAPGPALATSSSSCEPTSAAAAAAFIPVTETARVNEPAAGGKPVRVPQRQAPAPVAEPSVHIHVERHPDGLHLWFGASSLAVDALHRQLDLPALQRALPERLARVVCNGVPIQGGQSVIHPVTSPGTAGHNQEP